MSARKIYGFRPIKNLQTGRLIDDLKLYVLTRGKAASGDLHDLSGGIVLPVG
jgi:hypothetical protein